jgi:L-lysine exporter family protein LysE/ArgO
MPLSVVLAGLGTGLSLILPIGAQNAYVLRQGIRREHVGAIVVVCALSDMALMAAGTMGLDRVTRAAEWVVPVFRWGGAAFLAVYGLLAFRRAWRPGRLVADEAGTAVTLGRAVATCLAFTWLNPHVYLDTLVLVGSLANTHGVNRWWFAGGAMAGSWLFFPALGYGARLLRPLFASPTAWRVLDAGVGVVMWVVAASLILGA